MYEPTLVRVAPLMEIIPLNPSMLVIVPIKPKLGVKVKTGRWAQFGVFVVPNKI